jgi:CheY-specific phosphatase CheX
VDTPHELVGAFAAAVELTLRELAGVEAVRDAADAGPADVSAAMKLDGGAVRWAVLGFPTETAAALARRVLAGVGGEPDEGMVRDCAAEVLNVVAGQAKTLLYGTPYHFTFATPVAPPAGLAAGVAVGFRSECGPFALRVCPATGGGQSVTGSEG